MRCEMGPGFRHGSSVCIENMRDESERLDDARPQERSLFPRPRKLARPPDSPSCVEGGTQVSVPMMAGMHLHREREVVGGCAGLSVTHVLFRWIAVLVVHDAEMHYSQHTQARWRRHQRPSSSI
jgi:hypothetical protein